MLVRAYPLLVIVVLQAPPEGDATCASSHVPSHCTENGQPDDDCCADPGNAGCASGDRMETGEDCSWNPFSTAKEVCCYPTPSPTTSPTTRAPTLPPSKSPSTSTPSTQPPTGKPTGSPESNPPCAGFAGFTITGFAGQNLNGYYSSDTVTTVNGKGIFWKGIDHFVYWCNLRNNWAILPASDYADSSKVTEACYSVADTSGAANPSDLVSATTWSYWDGFVFSPVSGINVTCAAVPTATLYPTWQPPPPPTSPALSSRNIAVIIVGAFFVLLLCIAIVVSIWSRRMHAKMANNTFPQPDEGHAIADHEEAHKCLEMVDSSQMYQEAPVYEAAPVTGSEPVCASKHSDATTDQQVPNQTQSVMQQRFSNIERAVLTRYAARTSVLGVLVVVLLIVAVAIPGGLLESEDDGVECGFFTTSADGWSTSEMLAQGPGSPILHACQALAIISIISKGALSAFHAFEVSNGVRPRVWYCHIFTGIVCMVTTALIYALPEQLAASGAYVALTPGFGKHIFLVAGLKDVVTLILFARRKGFRGSCTCASDRPMPDAVQTAE